MILDIGFSTYNEFEDYLKEIERYIETFADIKKTIIMFSLIEGINNAFEHGVGWDPTKTVSLKLAKEKECLILQISHDGQPFNFTKEIHRIGNPECFLGKNIGNERGRGIPIMLHCSDELEYTKGGKNLVLTFNLE